MRPTTLGKLWKPNLPGTGNYHINNYVAPLPIKMPYKNFSDRADYQINDKLRVSGRYSLFVTPVSATNPTGSDYFQSDRGSQRDAKSITGDVTWTATANTVLNVRGEYHSFVDASKYDKASPTPANGPRSGRIRSFTRQTFAAGNIPILLPRMSISGTDNSRLLNMGPGGGYWDQRPNGDMFSFKISQQRGSHYLKAGADTRGSRARSFLSYANPGFGFDSHADQRHLRESEHADIRRRLCHVSDRRGAPTRERPVPGIQRAPPCRSWLSPTRPRRTYGAFINDDWKVNRNLTLNLGLRYEFQPAYTRSRTG